MTAEPPRRPLPRPLVWLLVPLAYYAGAKLGVSVAVMPEGIAVLWPPNSVLLTAMLLGRPREVALFALLGIVAEVAADVPTFSVREALVFGVANAIEATLAWALLRAWRFNPRLATLLDVRKFVVAGPLLAAAVAATLGAAVYAHYHGSQTDYLEFLRVWWLGDAMGLLIFTPLLLSLALPATGRAAPKRSLGVDLLVLAVALTLLALIVTPGGGGWMGVQVAPVLLLPCVLFVAARFDLRTTTATVGVIGLAVAYATAHGGAPFGTLPPSEASMRAQEFILSMSLLALGLAALLAQLRAQQRDIGEANARLDQLNRTLEARVAERTAQLDGLNRDLERLAMSDPLTGLLNRRAFFAIARGAVDTARRHQRPLAVLMIDVDRFKAINDRHGHAAGDQTLQHVAAMLTDQVRVGDTLARYGGEEFVLLASDIDFERALQMAQRMGDALRAAPLQLPGGAITVTASFGVTVLGSGDDDLDQLVRRADQALYAAKAAGRATAVGERPPQADASPSATPTAQADQPAAR
ncbi:MAG TPA: diguanylate cyclase [Burkholderiaceae bacterium]|nr:diguanylate cyclase [Burkholderiaceae bacterium]